MSGRLMVLWILLSIVLSVSGCAPLVKPTSKPPPPPGPPDPLTNVVVKADMIVLGTISALRYEETPNRFVYTIFTLTVEKVIKGDLNTKEVFIRIAGGLAQNPTGPWYFSKTDRVLVNLEREDGDVFRLSSPGVGWIQSSTTGVVPPMGLQETIGRIVGIMEDNNIPIAIPEGERPPRIRPVPTPVSPPKR